MATSKYTFNGTSYKKIKRSSPLTKLKNYLYCFLVILGARFHVHFHRQNYKQLVHAFGCAPSNYGALGKFGGYSSLLSFGFFEPSKLPECTIIRWSTLKHELIVNSSCSSSCSSCSLSCSCCCCCCFVVVVLLLLLLMLLLLLLLLFLIIIVMNRLVFATVKNILELKFVAKIIKAVVAR